MANQPKNNKLVVKLVAFPLIMFGFAFALVPLYDVLCEVTGLNGRTGVATGDFNYKVDKSRLIKVVFLSDTSNKVKLDFYPETTSMNIHPGQIYTMNYIAINNTNKPIYAHAVPSVAPKRAALKFKKIECFCFTNQKFMPGEKKVMPITYVIEPDVPSSVFDVSLSYFFVEDKQAGSVGSINNEDLKS